MVEDLEVKNKIDVKNFYMLKLGNRFFNVSYVKKMVEIGFVIFSLILILVV